jgi:hypothetical protein
VAQAAGSISWYIGSTHHNAYGAGLLHRHRLFRRQTTLRVNAYRTGSDNAPQALPSYWRLVGPVRIGEDRRKNEEIRAQRNCPAYVSVPVTGRSPNRGGRTADQSAEVPRAGVHARQSGTACIHRGGCQNVSARESTGKSSDPTK